MGFPVGIGGFLPVGATVGPGFGAVCEAEGEAEATLGGESGGDAEGGVLGTEGTLCGGEAAVSRAGVPGVLGGSLSRAGSSGLSAPEARIDRVSHVPAMPKRKAPIASRNRGRS